MFIDSSKNTNVFYIWGIFSTGNVKGIMQMTMGVDFAEQEWLNEGSYKTHILFEN
jgi:hypothetical protein